MHAAAGHPGFDVTVTRVFRDLQTGAELRRETFNTSYAAEAIIKCIPPAEPRRRRRTPRGLTGPGPGGSSGSPAPRARGPGRAVTCTLSG